MPIVELRDLDAAREYIVQGLWLQRVLKPSAATVKAALSYAHQIAALHHPLPPIGFVADVAAVAFGTDGGKWTKGQAELPGWSSALTRGYEDHLLGKLYADWTFERASDALRRYPEADQGKALAYVIKQFRTRGKLGGVSLSPAVLRSLLAANPDDLLHQGYDLFTRDGPNPLLVSQYEELVKAARRTAEVLDPEHVTALEQRMALDDQSAEYVAYEQVLRLAKRIEARLPTRPVRPHAGRREVPTRVLDEDQYPVGGYTSISTKGSIESLLHSQLAYMETEEQPDLFDMKFVRDELFYYSRDENQFLRRRRVFLFVFDPSLTDARVKDAAADYQRHVLALATVLAVVRRLSDWLSTDALRFELLFPPAKGSSPLDPEAKLFEILLSELRATGTAAVSRVNGADGKDRHTKADQFAGVLDSPDGVWAYCERVSRTAQVQVLAIGTDPAWKELETAVVTTLAVNGPTPTLTDGNGELVPLTEDDQLSTWVEVALRVLGLWV
ncbi:MAG: hypothetical protein ACOVT5_13125 [Armatimonadaceae bacterium]